MPYFDMNLDLTWEDQEIKASAHRFAREVMRPIAREVDRMSAQDAVAKDSPLWEFLRKAYALGYHKALFPTELGGLGFTPLQGHILNEEIIWGSLGLSGVLLLASWPFYKVLQAGNQRLIEEFVVPFCRTNKPDITACWAVTEPDRGSDTINVNEPFFSAPGTRGNVQARQDGDEWVINGQKSAWVSCGPIASHCMLNVQTDASKGLAGGAVCILPLDLPGVSRGKALEKVGQRDLPQGELFFNDVQIPNRYMFVREENYSTWVANNLAFGNAAMTLFAIGLARAGFDEAFGYAKERVQGGKVLIDHYFTKIRIARMFGKVEAIRATSRAVWNLAVTVYPPYPEYSYAAKAVCTEMAREVIDEAVQLHGANGLTKEYPVEKFWRDSRALTIEDGENNTLCAMAGHFLKDTYPRADKR
ncbi:MAG: acyl-CoA dehydrogenase [Deltaproteobacteria bacterium]|nr:MAG: acyl-CoA dehydrogenase [Deltaproteobacteria bacterium]